MRERLLRTLAAAAIGLAVGCSANARPALPPAALPEASASAEPATQVPAPELELVDPYDAVIARSDALFNQGQSELKLGHLTAARQLFDRAVDVMLEAPGGARSDERLRGHFDSLLSQISALEILALREGDGFTETAPDSTVVDELLEAVTLSLPEPALATEEAVAADLAETVHDLPIDNNERVQAFVELFQGNLHDFMQASLERSAQYLPMVQEVFRAEGIPLDLAYLGIVESGYKTNAASRASARGIWQFIPSTGKEHGLRQDWFLDERSDPEKSTRAAAQYLKSLNLAFDGDWNMAMASYNAGPGRLQRAVTRSKVNDFWELSATSKYLPRETRNYVPMVMAAVLIAKNPEAYGFASVPVAPLAFDRVTVPDALDLRTVAEWTETTIEEMRGLNPELRRNTTPVGPHDLKVPVGTARLVEEKLASADPSIFAKFVPYQVKRGDTLSGIARKAGFKASDIASANNIRLTSTLRIGQMLMLPRVPVSALASGTSASGTTLTYRVKRGDTLSAIARQFDTTVANIQKWNSLTTTKLAVGDRLTIHRN